MELDKIKQRKTNHTIVAIIVFIATTVILWSAWEETQPLMVICRPELRIPALNRYFGGLDQKAIWAAAEQSRKDLAQNDTSSSLVLNSPKSAAARASSGGKCDFTRGRWVMDDKSRPLYDGTKCKAYLSSMWACRETNRSDFEYEKLRWQPDGCDLPAFSSHKFLERLENKVLAFVGDSLGRQQFQSLMCMLTEGEGPDEVVEDVVANWNLSTLHGRNLGYAYRFERTNTTVVFVWSATLAFIELNRTDEEDGWSALHIDQPDVFLRDRIQDLDLLILNSGHHWNRLKFSDNKWHMYMNGQPIPEAHRLYSMPRAYNYTMHKQVKFLDAKLTQTGGKPTVFMRSLSPRHFKNGDWNTGGTCDNNRQEVDRNVNNKGPLIDRVMNNVGRSSKRIHLLDIIPLSSTREEGHISKYGSGRDSGHQDCLHWCLPGVPDTWNELMYGYLATDSSLAAPSFAGSRG
ncbi:hypothetical protein R1sor_015360 [Riccia sorocarpa]|uniref:Trichome birefringence-like N-terminal domain-containing protein n=1 Tax=Riccia sorocarpa TaxID=122646 RepID=A0ABD3HG89_9MARC